ncbi:MAG: hypothetical protein CMP11_06895 [Zetaproteobacteria bacterium]|nr:hypothetical protein [Pseudobdellovibrionaceae bacterium]
MSKNISLLSIILVFQLGLTWFFQNKPSQTAVYQKTATLVDVNFDNINKINVTDNENKEIILYKDKGTWKLPDSDNFPVSQEKIDGLIKKIAGFKRPRPVGTSEIAAKQFSVSDDKFERKIDLFENDKKITTIFLGTSPGFRKVHLRLASEELTYSVEFNTYDVPTKDQDWFEKDLLVFDKKDIESVKFEKFNVLNQDGNYILEGLKQNEETKTETLSNLISSISNLSFSDVAGIKLKSNYKSLMTFSVSKKDKNKISYEIYADDNKKETKGTVNKDNEENEKQKSYVLKSSEYPYFFQVSTYTIEKILNAKLQNYTKQKADNSNENISSSPLKPEVSGN